MDIRTKTENQFGSEVFIDGGVDCLVKSNSFGELPYSESLSCYDLGRILYAGINPQIRIAEDDRELFALLTICHNTGMRSDKLGVYLMRAVSLILQNGDRKKGYAFAGYRGKIAENLRDDALRAAIDCVKYWNPARVGKGKKPAFSFVTYCIIRRMKGTLTRHKKKLINRIKNSEKNGGLANPELYIALGAFTKENYFDGRKICMEDSSMYAESREYYDRIKSESIRRLKERYSGNNEQGNSLAAS